MVVRNIISLETKGCRKKAYYKSIGYDISGDFIDIKIEHITPGSRHLIDVQCDYCESVSNITCKEYFRNISLGGKYSCSKKCGSEKAKESNVDKYGVEYPMMLDEVQGKAKKTNLERYGVEFLQQSTEMKERSKKTLMSKYGVDHISKSKMFGDKFRKTCMDNHGVEYPMQSIDIREKSKVTLLNNYGVDNPSKSDVIRDSVVKTNLERYGGHYMKTDDGKEHHINLMMSKYGVDNISKLENTKDKIKKTNLERYGYIYTMQNSDVKEKSRETCILKYGVDNPSKSPGVRDKVKKTNLNRYGSEHFMSSDTFRDISKSTMLDKYGDVSPTISESLRISNYKMCKDVDYLYYVGYSTSVFKCVSGHDFEIKTDNYHTRNKAGVPLCTICNPIGNSSSIKEKELCDYVSSVYSGEVIQSYRDGLEIDIYLPELKIGFEFNGLYWHSEEYKNKNYHLNKTNHFKERGIRIIHIWEDDWILKRDIIESQISNLVGLVKNRVYARKCEVVILDNCSDFLNVNHVQGKDRSVVKMGLLYNSELVSVMTFNKLEGRKKLPNGEWNLSRFCNLLNHSVVGGSSKLLSHFIKYNEVSRVVSYADADWSVGNLYLILGFLNILESKPDYKYVVCGVRRHKQNYKKKNLGIQGQSITEKQHMASLGYYRIWDCGKIKFEKIINL